MTNPLKALVGQTAVYGLSSIVGKLLNYLLVPLYTRIFAPEEYGVVTELYAYVVFLMIVLTYGMETAFFRFSDTREKMKTAYNAAMIPLLATSSLFAAAVLLFDTQIAAALGYSGNAEYIRWFAIIIAVDALVAVPFARLRRQNKALKFAIFRLINIGVNIGLNLFFLVLCPYLLRVNPDSVLSIIYSPSIGVGYIFISNLIASLLTLVLFLPDILKIELKIDKKTTRAMLIYGIPLLVSGLAGSVNEVLDRVLLKHFLPETSNTMEQIGIYGANYKVAILMTLFIQTFRYAAEPFFFAHYKNKKSLGMYADVMKYFIIFGLFIFIGIMLYIDVIKHFIDARYHSGIGIVPVLLMANLFLGIIFNLSIWYKLTSKTKFAILISGFGALITIILNVIFIPIIGYWASAWATFVCYFSMMILSFFIGRKHLLVPYNLKAIIIYISLAMSIFGISLLIRPENLVLRYFINTCLLFVFSFIIYKKEVRKLLQKKYQ